MQIGILFSSVPLSMCVYFFNPCRYHKSIRQNEESVDISSVIVPPLGRKRYPRLALLPPENTSLDLVYFCRKIYDFRQHRLLKNPFFV